MPSGYPTDSKIAERELRTAGAIPSSKLPRVELTGFRPTAIPILRFPVPQTPNNLQMYLGNSTRH